MSVSELLLDFEASLVRNAFGMIDTQLETLERYIEQDYQNEGDSAFFEDSEYLHGIGFVTAQRFLTSTCSVFGVDKSKAFEMGPKTSENIPIAALVNAVANHWKHSEEWPWDSAKDEWDLKKLPPNQERQVRKTIETIQAIGVKVSRGGYVSANVLAKLNLKTFRDLIPILKAWGNDVATALHP